MPLSPSSPSQQSGSPNSTTSPRTSSPVTITSANPLSTFKHPEHWSGKGQYDVEFERRDKLPLEEVTDLGFGASGDVYKVTCQGVTLARKRIYLKRRVNSKEVRGELDILKRLSHKHIITLVGSYSQGSVLGLLLFPAAVCDLGDFLKILDKKQQGQTIDKDIHDLFSGALELSERFRFTHTRLKRVYGCLANGMKYLHDNKIRHKDLKPVNILLHFDNSLYITDFGISKDSKDADDSVTSGAEVGTLKYCAPEISRDEPRNRSADIYSLGCTFLEMATVYFGLSLADFAKFRTTGSDSTYDSFHNSQAKLPDWISKLRSNDKQKNEEQGIFSILDIIDKMIAEDPEQRPKISTICSSLELLDLESMQKSIFNSYYGNCCRPRVVSPAHFDKIEGQLDKIEGKLILKDAKIAQSEEQLKVYREQEREFNLERRNAKEEAQRAWEALERLQEKSAVEVDSLRRQLYDENAYYKDLQSSSTAEIEDLQRDLSVKDADFRDLQSESASKQRYLETELWEKNEHIAYLTNLLREKEPRVRYGGPDGQDIPVRPRIPEAYPTQQSTANISGQFTPTISTGTYQSLNQGQNSGPPARGTSNIVNQNFPVTSGETNQNQNQTYRGYCPPTANSNNPRQNVPISPPVADADQSWYGAGYSAGYQFNTGTSTSNTQNQYFPAPPVGWDYSQN